MGSLGDSMMAVLTGNIRISVSSSEGKEIVLAIMQPDDFFGELALLDGKARSADAKAIADCSLAVLERRDVLAFFDRHPSAWLGLVQVLCRRLRATTERTAEVALLGWRRSGRPAGEPCAANRFIATRARKYRGCDTREHQQVFARMAAQRRD
jgi:CRP-like cAMP-binding protein